MFKNPRTYTRVTQFSYPYKAQLELCVKSLVKNLEDRKCGIRTQWGNCDKSVLSGQLTTKATEHTFRG